MLILQKEERTGFVQNRKMMPNCPICLRTAMGVSIKLKGIDEHKNKTKHFKNWVRSDSDVSNIYKVEN